MRNREEALNLMREWVNSESLRNHMLCVEAAMRAYANKYGEDPEAWGLAGLLHDMDYEKHPEVDVLNKTGHPFEAVRKLKRLNYPKEIIDAILGHALYSNVPRTSQMAKCLYACDELCGFLVACALMRTDGFETLTAQSVKKKLKDKKFAAKVSREDITQSIAELGISENEHIDFVIQSLKPLTKMLIDK